MPRLRVRTLLLALALLAAGVPSARAAVVETAHLVVGDATGRLSPAQLEERAGQVQVLLDKLLAFWDADSRVDRFGKILVTYCDPGGDSEYAIFRWVKEGDRKVREVRVVSAGNEPQMLAHKLTCALYPSRDKLIRNMMGEISEMRLGNPLTFPHCGLCADAWVLALLRLGRFVPLRELGPEHASWGMGTSMNGVPFTRDQDRHHRTYAEAGSFGNFLFTMYGREKLKELCRLTSDSARPWEATYGIGLDALEAQWLEALRREEARLEPEIVLAAQLYQRDPAKACGEAQARRGARP